MKLRDIVKNFVVSRFDITDDFFNTAWDFVNANYSKIHDSIVSAKGRLDQADIPLAFVGKTEGQAVKAILIFTTGFKEVDLKGDIGQSILSSIQNACNQYKAEIKLKEEILQTVESSKKEIINFFKQKQPTEKLKPGKKKLEYVIFWNRRKEKLISAEEAEKIRESKGRAKTKLFIDDERKEVFFNKKLIDKFQGQMYSMLRHFVINEGVGGSKDKIYQEVWEDYTMAPAEENIDGAVDVAMKRFRDILKKNNICDVKIRTEGVFASKKIYLLYPKISYCILRRIEIQQGL